LDVIDRTFETAAITASNLFALALADRAHGQVRTGPRHPFTQGFLSNALSRRSPCSSWRPCPSCCRATTQQCLQHSRLRGSSRWSISPGSARWSASSDESEARSRTRAYSEPSNASHQRATRVRGAARHERKPWRLTSDV